eukprot:4715772-Prorocentrum_lima.AAC.1
MEPIVLEQQTHTPSCLFKEPDEMEPTIQRWVCMRDPETKPMWIRADGATIRTYPFKVELLLGDDQQ